MSHISIPGVTVTSPTPVKARPHPLSVTNAERQMMKVIINDDDDIMMLMMMMMTI